MAREGKSRVEEETNQGKRILILLEEHLSEVGIIPTGFEPSDFDAVAATLLLAQ